MNKRPLVQMAQAFILGILWSCGRENPGFPIKGIWILLPALILLLISIFECIKKGHGKRGIVTAVFLAAGFLLGAYRHEEETVFRERYEPYLLDGEETVIQGDVDKKETKNDNNLIYLKNSFVRICGETIPCNDILVYLDSGDYPPGKTLIIKGKIKKLNTVTNEGGFDEKSYYQSRMVDFKFYGDSVTGEYGKTDRLREALYELKERIGRVFSDYLSKDEAGILSAMILGDRTLLDTEVKSLYQQAGISHVLAISGLHISVLGMTLYGFLRKRGKRFGISGMTAGGVIYLYAMMTGFGTSAVRAVSMFFLLLLAPACKKTYDSLSAMALAALILLMENPFLLFYSGFQFSFLAVLGVAVVGNTLVQHGRECPKLFENILVSVGIQAATLPLVAWNYYEIPLYAVVVNLFVLPFMGVLLGTGILGGILGLFCGLPAGIVLLVPHLILSGLKWICGIAGRLPGASYIVGKPSLAMVLVYYAALFLGVLFLKKQKKILTVLCGNRDWKEKRFAMCPAALLLAVLLFGRKQKGFEIDVLDVGQGDGIFLATEDGVRTFFDGGSTDETGVGTYRILPFLKAKGIKSIDYWFVSHTDADHINGLEEVLAADYPVYTLVFSERIPDDEAYLGLVETAEEHGTEILFMKAGDSLHTKTAEFTCVFPDRKYEETDKNALSMVIRYDEGEFGGLFTGDISENEEAWILENSELDKTTFYKAAHHGSKTSNSKAFLDVLAPEITAVSCGKDNSYGHPAPETVERLTEAGTEIFYTMESGRIRITKKKGKIVTEGMLEVTEAPVLQCGHE